MSRALLYRSIPLSRTTRDAWKSAGAMFAKRERTPEQVRDLAGGRPIINLGSSNLTLPGIWNEASVIAPLLTPAGSRQLFDTVMPSDGWQGEGYYWLKGQGRGGANKEKTYVTTEYSHNELVSRANWIAGDVQQNIGGGEYRVITVGTKVVQVMKRGGLNGNRVYEWVGLTGAPTSVKEVAREAARRLESEKIIIGWDVMDGDGYYQWTSGTYILEGNSCPGVNAATAGRILDAMEGIDYAA